MVERNLIKQSQIDCLMAEAMAPLISDFIEFENKNVLLLDVLEVRRFAIFEICHVF